MRLESGFKRTREEAGTYAAYPPSAKRFAWADLVSVPRLMDSACV